MRVFRDPNEVSRGDGRVVTIGAFDGVHLGHRAVLRLVRELASARGLPATVLTFDRHPAEIVRPEHAPRLLTTLDQKLELLEQTGDVDECVVLVFDAQRSKETADAFVEHVLAGALRARMIVVGADFHFGYRRRGSVALLQQMGADLGFEVLGLGLVATPDAKAAADDAVPYSSTRIRELLALGDVGGAADILGRDHAVTGPVRSGDRRGRELGFPTANVAVSDRVCLPADGIYAGFLSEPNAPALPAAISLGRRPTFYADDGLRLLEAFIFDFDDDLYDRTVTVSFRERIRGQVRFEGPSATQDLVAQMRADVLRCREILKAG